MKSKFYELTQSEIDVVNGGIINDLMNTYSILSSYIGHASGSYERWDKNYVLGWATCTLWSAILTCTAPGHVIKCMLTLQTLALVAKTAYAASK